MAPSIVSTGTVAATANSVANPSSLVPGLPATRAADDVLLCLTSCRLAAPTVATPTGWTPLLNVAGTSGRIALFAREVDGTETAPTVTWSGMTTGTSGSAAQAVIAAVRGLELPVVVDVAGAVSNQAASTTAAAGGAAITTVTPGSIAFVMSSRQDDAGTWAVLPVSDAVTWAKVLATQVTTAGADHAQEWQYGIKTAAGAIAAKTFTLTGGVSFASAGVMVALRPAPAITVDKAGGGEAEASAGGTSEIAQVVDAAGGAGAMASAGGPQEVGLVVVVNKAGGATATARSGGTAGLDLPGIDKTGGARATSAAGATKVVAVTKAGGARAAIAGGGVDTGTQVKVGGAVSTARTGGPAVRASIIAIDRAGGGKLGRRFV